MDKDFQDLPEDLPVPEDDGATDHLSGVCLPSIPLRSTDGDMVNLSKIPGRTVIYAYPRTGRPDEPVFYEHWESIPGARGCTPESCAFRDHYHDIKSAGAGVYGLSTQDTEFQREAVGRLHLPFSLLSDEKLEMTRALALPTFTVKGIELLKRLTLIVNGGVVEHVFYPVFPPDAHAAEVLDWLRAH